MAREAGYLVVEWIWQKMKSHYCCKPNNACL
jgi:hypothetical protein